MTVYKAEYAAPIGENRRGAFTLGREVRPSVEAVDGQGHE